MTPALELRSLGFVPSPSGAGYRRRGTSFEVQGRWGVLVSTFRDGARLGDPGLWREQGPPLRDGPGGGGGRGARQRRVFELPPWMVGHGPWLVPGEEPEAVRHDVLRWALTTANGNRVAGWTPPAAEEVRGWIPAGGLTVETGGLARQGRLIHEPRRLALVFDLSPAVAELAADRRHWLREVLLDARARWRLVRVGQTADGAVQGEVDLSGAPHAALEPLFRMALDALRWVVGWLLESVHFLVEGTAGCRALAVRPS